jgi:hypothetical protein
MEIIIATVAFVALFVAWVVIPTTIKKRHTRAGKNVESDVRSIDEVGVYMNTILKRKAICLDKKII